MIDVWLAPIAQHLGPLLDDLSAAELERAARINHPRRLASFVSAHSLVRRVLGERLSLAARDVPIDRACRTCGGDDHGKPFIVGVEPATVFSLSVAPTLVGVAVAASGSLGLDLDARTAGRTWVRREAVLKATGHGLTIDPARVLVTDEEAKPELLYWPLGPLRDVHLYDLEPTTDVIGCVAWRGVRVADDGVVVHRLENR